MIAASHLKAKEDEENEFSRFGALATRETVTSWADYRPAQLISFIVFVFVFVFVLVLVLLN